MKKFRKVRKVDWSKGSFGYVVSGLVFLLHYLMLVTNYKFDFEMYRVSIVLLIISFAILIFTLLLVFLVVCEVYYVEDGKVSS